MRFYALLAGATLLLAAGATAQSLEEAEAAYADGRFIEAADLAEALGTSNGYAVAARSLAVYVRYEATEEDFDEVAQRAMRMAKAAIEADSTNTEAYVQSSHAIGRYAQGVGLFTALRQGLADRVREPIDATLAIDPDHVVAMMALAAWHADIAAEGFFARRLYGGSEEEAVRLFERALELAPESKDLLFEYGSRLHRLDKERGVERAREMLERAVYLPVRDVYEEYLHLEILDAIDALGPPTPRSSP